MAKVDVLGEALLKALGIDLSHNDVLWATLVWQPGHLSTVTVTYAADPHADEVIKVAKSYRLVPVEES